ncbi:PIR Superfamily Protein [Plasmodium ovale wallikeri]|uniref:PIR Superfamily Protein n=1 Tax=Plasmodium ovale wallikeri TaxID=864142 RepID=A0A1A9ANV2_PLAOA|nr:PIR Superfamily Protein [Plasmodium ovale wallikeri]SBT57897.1 PIR Superfamily Protein [Plasmodium ovale wallikeri]
MFALKDIFQNSYSYILYNSFDNVNGLSNYEDYCSGIKSKTAYSNLEELCKKFVANLKNINEKNNDTSSKVCLHLNYWILSEISKKIGNGENNLRNVSILSNFSSIRDTITNEFRSKWLGGGGVSQYYCFCDFENILENWKEEKIMHDYTKNVETIKKNYCSKDDKKDIFKKYLTDIGNLYKKHFEECCPWLDGSCPNYFSCNPDYAPDKLLSDLKCNSTETRNGMPVEGSASSESNSNQSEEWLNFGYLTCSTTSHMHGDSSYPSCRIESQKVKVSDYPAQTVNIGKPTFPEVYELEETPTQPNDDASESSDKGKNTIEVTSKTNICVRLEDEDSGSTSNSDDNLDSASSSSSPTASRSRKKCIEPGVREHGTIGITVRGTDPIPHITVKSDGTIVATIPSSLSTESTLSEEKSAAWTFPTMKISMTFLLVLGFLIVSFLYCKFTPFGSFIRRKVFGKKEIEDDLYERYADDYSSYDDEPMYENSHGRKLRIAYNSA